MKITTCVVREVYNQVPIFDSFLFKLDGREITLTKATTDSIIYEVIDSFEGHMTFGDIIYVIDKKTQKITEETVKKIRKFSNGEVHVVLETPIYLPVDENSEEYKKALSKAMSELKKFKEENK